MTSVIKGSPSAAQAIFSAAVQLEDDASREAFVELACRGNDALRSRIRALLDADERPADSPLRNVGDRVTKEPAAPGPATTETFITDSCDGNDDASAPPLDVAKHPQIGPYTIRELIGEGGMGYVYVAEQTRPVRRKVALKVIKPGMDTKEVIARFEAERQALAMMSHPNIAKVLDAGATDQGRPYFVMELVRGEPITKFCDQQKLTTRERLELFLKVCRAVQHAHMKGIIHRDLKPSNVIVEVDDVRPIPKVIDFGVAKATGQQLSQHTIYTQFSQLVGTPLYMSPEQAKQSSTDIDTRSDIYSLGVLLYELLTGTTPFDKETLSSVDITELQRIICEDEPPRPSQRISTLKNEQLTTISASRKAEPRQLSLSMQRELDWIVMKALEKDRTRRYESASAFAADIQRYLDDEPVLACPPSVGYRTRKFVLRHKVGIVISSMLFLAILLSASTISIARSQQNQAAQREERRLERVARDVSLTLEAARAAIEAGDLRIAARKGIEAESRLANDRDALAILRTEVADFQRELLRREEDQHRFQDFLHLASVAEDRFTYERLGAEDSALESLALFGVLSHDDWTDRLANSTLSREQQAEVKSVVYDTLTRLASRHLDSEEAAHRSLAYLDLASQCEHPTKAYYYVLSECHRLLDRPDESKQALERFHATPATDPLDHNLVAHVAFERGGAVAQLNAYRAALRLQPDHYDSLYSLGVRLLESANHYPDAKEKYTRYAEAVGYMSACIALRPDSFAPHIRRAHSFAALGNISEAHADYEHALTLAETQGESKLARQEFGRGLRVTDNPDAAWMLLSELITAQPQRADLYHFHGVIALATGRWSDALCDFDKIVELEQAEPLPLIKRGQCYLLSGMQDQAILDFAHALRIEVESSPSTSDPRGPTLVDLMWACAITDGVFDQSALSILSTTEYLPRRHVAVDTTNPEIMLQHAGWLLLTRQYERYSEFCRDGVSRHASTAKGRRQYVLARMLALDSPEGISPGMIMSLARGAVEDDPLPWRQHALGLALIRSGQYEQAVEQFELSEEGGWSWGVGCNLLGQSIAHSHLGDLHGAQRFLALAREWCAEWRIEEIDLCQVDRPGGRTEVHPHDRIAAQLLLREAEMLVGGIQAVDRQDSPPPQTTNN